MGKFALGVIVTLLVLVLGGLGLAMLGFFPTAANVEPPHMERRLAMGAVDASMERHAPRITNPLTSTDPNLEDGMKLYTMNCALCHGGRISSPTRPTIRSGTSSTPSAPVCVTPACPPGTKLSASRTCGRSPCCSPTSINFHRRCRNIGKPASGSSLISRKKKECTIATIIRRTAESAWWALPPPPQ